MIPVVSRPEALRVAVLGWYRANGRPLAFRRTTDPWAILVSEFMAQQTQAARAAEAWERFLVAYPTPASLAAASPADALRAWRGLGYNRRALALRAAAIRMVERHGGRVPTTLEELDALPGVGAYTARAVAALAFGQAVGAVDTNVRRVLGRALFDAPPAPASLQAVADAMVPPGDPGEWTHALMDIGATFCRPRNPRCGSCPVAAWCRYANRASNLGDARAGGPDRRLAASSRTRSEFHLTSRWLRGRILDRLRDAHDGRWVELGGEPIGAHDGPVVEVALEALAREGLVELRPGAPTSARLPLG